MGLRPHPWLLELIHPRFGKGSEPIKPVSLLLCAALLAGLLAPVAAAQEAAVEEDPGSYAGYIVKLSDGMPRMRTLSADASYDREGNFLVVDTLEQTQEIPEEYIDYIEPNYYVELFSTQDPSDPYYADYQWSLQEIGAMSAYRQGLTGEGVKVGFVDSGINTAHVDLDDARIDGANFHADGLSFDQDVYGHGTFAAGIVAAQTDNGVGLAGVAPGADIRAYRVFNQKTTTMDAVVSAIYAAIGDGCDVINLSLGTQYQSNTLRTAIEAAEAAGIVLVAAVGNDGSSTLQYPAAYSAVIGVGSVDSGLTVSSFSQRNRSVYVTAPGGGVAGLDHESADGYKLDLTSKGNMGTSYAAPVVAGMAALALGYDRDLTEDGFRYLLETTSTDKGSSGYDTTYGYGVVNIDAFVSELRREFTITYETNGGVLPENAVQAYAVTDDTLTLPTPTRPGFQFTGWYAASDLSGGQVSAIPAGSLGDLEFFAAWQSDQTTAVQSVLVNGQTAVPQADGSYRAYLPYGTVLADLTPNNIVVTPLEAGSVAEPAVTEDGGRTWTFQVHTSGDASHAQTYTLYLEVDSLHVADGSAAQSGSAVPASHDGQTPAIPYCADAAAWFLDGESQTLPDDFTCQTAVEGGSGLFTLDGSTLTYIPSAEDAGQAVTLRVQGVHAGRATLDAVTITLAVGALPVSQSKALTPSLTYDRNTGGGAELSLALFGNQVTGVSLDAAALTDGQYALGEVTTDGAALLTLEDAPLAALENGAHTVTVTFDAGAPAAVPLTVCDSTPLYTVTFRSQGAVFDTRSGVYSGSTVTLPHAPVREDYDFQGWYTQENGKGTRFTTQTPVTDSLTLYAYWTATVPSGGGGGGGGGGGVGGGGGGSVAVPAETVTAAQTSANTITEAGGVTTLTLLEEAATSVESEALVRENAAHTVVLTGRGVTVTVPAGTLPEGFDVNRLLPDRRAFTGAPGEVLAYVDENGGLHPLPWVVVGADELIFTTGIAADYRIVNAKGIFDDVMADDWYADSVAFVTARGLFSGTDEAVFSPDAPMTRGMLMTVLARLDGADTAGGSPWYKPGMDWAVTRGISDGSAPGAPITREQLAAMLWRYAGNPVSQGSLDGFTDAGKVSAYAAEALRWVVGAGLITGTDAGALNPQGEASRAEVSAMLTRFIMVKAE